MKTELNRLLSFTEGCREDFHEPDEQDITAKVIGDHLDNAMGSCINDEPFLSQEYLVLLTRDNKTEVFNLATLIALARKANL